MSRLNNIVYLSAKQLETLMTDKTITVGDTTINFDDNDLYMTPDEDKYVLYSSTGTVTTATPSAGTDAVNLDYFNANTPNEKTYYRHNIHMFMVVDDYITGTFAVDFAFYSTSASAAADLAEINELCKGENIVASIYNAENPAIVKTAILIFSASNNVSIQSEILELGGYSGDGIELEDIVTEI